MCYALLGLEGKYSLFLTESLSPLSMNSSRMGVTLHQSSDHHGHSHGSTGPPDSHKPQQNASVRAAFIHVIGDLLQSLGVLIASYAIYFKVKAIANSASE